MTHSPDLVYISLKFNLVASCHLSYQNQNMRGLWSSLCLISLLRGVSASTIDVTPFNIGVYVASIMFFISRIIDRRLCRIYTNRTIGSPPTDKPLQGLFTFLASQSASESKGETTISSKGYVCDGCVLSTIAEVLYL